MFGQGTLSRPRAEDPYAKLPRVASFSVESHDLTDGQPLPLSAVAAAAGGQELSPHLRWSGAPPTTRSYALTCFDPDAPTPSGFWHWAVVDLPAGTAELAAGAVLPEGAYALPHDGGQRGYAGAAPPPGDHPHRYYFVVHAVDVDRLGVPPSATPAVLSFNLAFHTLARAMIVPTYARDT